MLSDFRTAHPSAARGPEFFLPGLLFAGTLLLTLLACGSGERSAVRPPLASLVRVGILSRYHPRSLRVESAGGRIHTGTDSSVFRDVVTVRLERRGLVFEAGSVRGVSEHLVIDPEGSYSVTLPLSKGSEKGDVTRTYTGSLEIGVSSGELALVNVVDSGSYVSRVAEAELGPLLARERDPGRRKELRRAMEIVVRSYLNRNLKRHEHDGYDTCDLTHCMFYPGGSEGPSSPDRSVLIDASGHIVNAYFHSTCGGRLASPNVMWPDAPSTPGLYRSGFEKRSFFSREAVCAPSPHFRWETELSSRALLRILGRGELAKVDTLETVESEGRVRLIRYEGRSRTGEVLRGVVPVAGFLSSAGRALGWNRIKSNSFTIHPLSPGYRLNGEGLGHGVGLCQWGAAHMAGEGEDARSILRFYFPGAALVEGVYR